MVASDKVDFLCYELLAVSIRPQKRLAVAIEKFQQPECKKNLKSFLGLAGFYRTFMETLAHISHALNKLTSDNVTLVWNGHCRKAFNELKLRLRSKPVLVFPRVGEKFIEDVDASELEFGGVLMQEGEDKQMHRPPIFRTLYKNHNKIGQLPRRKHLY